MIISITVVLFILFIFWFLFPRVLVCGDSMYPTYKDDEIIWSTRVFSKKKIKCGDVVVVKFPKTFMIEGNRTVIKRVHYCVDNYIYLLGDNPSESYDSRYYGEIPVSFVKCKILSWREYEEAVKN